MQAHLKSVNDPDAGWFLDVAATTGHRLGVSRKSSRASAIFERKTEWRLPELDVEDDMGRARWAPVNYSWARDNLKGMERERV